MSRNSLTRLAQGSLFDIDSPLRGNVRGERNLMDFPFFPLAKKPQTEEIVYNHQNVTIQIRAGSGGIATMYDKEILLYLIALMKQALDRGDPVGPEFTFTAHDFFSATNVQRPSKRNYDALSGTLERLQGTQIKTNIETGQQIDRNWFSWLSEAQVTYAKLKNGDEQLKMIRVRLCNWFFRALEKDGHILHYHQDYFRLGTVERRLYEIARCHCQDDLFEMPLDEMSIKIGSNMNLRQLKLTLKEIARENRIPEFTVSLRDVVPATPRLDTKGRRITTPDTVVVMEKKPQQIRSSAVFLELAA
jgi:plasmid replication initiation protein